MLPYLCSVIDHRRCQYVVRTSVTHSPNSLCATFLLLTYFEIICDLLLDGICNRIYYFVNNPYYWIATHLWVHLVRVKLKTHNLMLPCGEMKVLSYSMGWGGNENLWYPSLKSDSIYSMQFWSSFFEAFETITFYGSILLQITIP